MSELQLDLITLENHWVEDALNLIRDNQPEEGYWGCFSGGKDSVVIKRLTEMCGAKIVWHYSVTNLDPPELVRFIKQEHPDVHLDIPKETFFQVARRKGFPTRVCRWCCSVFKEARSPRGAVHLMGLRAEESSRRANSWRPVTVMHRKRGIAINPIFHWRLLEVWGFIEQEQIPYCSLYDEGFDRLGCIGCPMARESGRRIQFARWPHYEKRWRRLFQQVWELRTGSLQRNGKTWFGDAYFDNWEEMWDWWLCDKSLPLRKC